MSQYRETHNRKLQRAFSDVKAEFDSAVAPQTAALKAAYRVYEAALSPSMGLVAEARRAADEGLTKALDTVAVQYSAHFAFGNSPSLETMREIEWTIAARVAPEIDALQAAEREAATVKARASEKLGVAFDTYLTQTEGARAALSRAHATLQANLLTPEQAVLEKLRGTAPD